MPATAPRTLPKQEMNLLPLPTPFRLTALMSRFSRPTTLLLACVLALVAAGPATALAADSDSSAGDIYVLDTPEAGNESGAVPAGAENGSSSGSEGDSGTVAAAAGSADDGGLPILLVVLAGTAIIGIAIAIMRRKRTT